MFGKRVPNCVKREGKYFVNDAFGDVVFESIEKENALNFLRQNYLELNLLMVVKDHFFLYHLPILIFLEIY